LVKEANKQLKNIINYAYNYVPYYTKLFDGLGISPKDINSIEELQKLPILTKEVIKKNFEDFIPKNINSLRFINDSTGGSTGIPLKYRMSLEDYERGPALLYRGWSTACYKLGDKVAVIAGSSLIPNVKTDFTFKIFDFFLNQKHYSSYNLSEQNLFKYLQSLNSWKPKFIRGYSSSIYLVAKFIDDNQLTIKFHPKAIFTTAEKLLEHQKKMIEKVFNTEVFDNYGLNDGGVSAYECPMHKGLHIDMERAILEVVDEDGKQIFDKPGKILATNLFNYALSFIRYDTGDLGVVSSERCSCSRETLLLKEVIGRTTDSLILNGINIGSPVLTVLMGKFDIEQYQIVQDSEDSITIRIVKEQNFSKRDEDFIRKSFFAHVGEINIKFDYVDSIVPFEGQKHKFIINKVDEYRK
jgi:phenylacetate-CoA ligase